jgi:hypothetical protein
LACQFLLADQASDTQANHFVAAHSYTTGRYVVAVGGGIRSVDAQLSQQSSSDRLSAVCEAACSLNCVPSVE